MSAKARVRHVEHVGDAVILLATRLYLMEKCPFLNAQQWQLATNEIVCNKTLARLGKARGLEPLGNSKHNGHANAYEVLIGTVFMEHDFEVASFAFVTDLHAFANDVIPQGAL